MFRIPELKATINRYGFNSLGADAVEDNLQAFGAKAKADPLVKGSGLVGVNLGKNKMSKDAAQDYSIGQAGVGQAGLDQSGMGWAQ